MSEDNWDNIFHMEVKYKQAQIKTTLYWISTSFYVTVWLNLDQRRLKIQGNQNWSCKTKTNDRKVRQTEG